MPRPLCSVVFATYNRWHLLKSSIECYNRSRFPLNRLELVVVDDASTDETAAVLDTVDPKIDLKYIRLRKQPGLWRDCAAVINVGLRAAKGSVVIATHPEILPGRDSVQFVCDTAKDNVWACCKGYYLSRRDQDRLPTVDWINKGPIAVREIEGFYDADQAAVDHPDYTPQAIESIGNGGPNATWESWIFAGMNRRTWSHFGGFVETTAWGSVDILTLQRRRKSGITNVTGTADNTIVVHQNHDLPTDKFVPTNRDMNACFGQCPPLTPEQCRYPFVDELWGPIP